MKNIDGPRQTGHNPVKQDTAHASPFTTPIQAEYRADGWKRLLAAGVLALAGLGAFIIFGPKEEEIKRRFEYYGVEGEIQIMNEISIDDGHDNIAQLPKSLRVPPPPAKLEIEEDKPDPEGTEVMPEERDADPNKIDVNTKNPLPDSEASENYQVEMSLPMQASRDVFLLSGTRPEYPLQASEAERRTPIIVVEVAVFVDPKGIVTHWLIEGSTGGKIFEDAVIAAVREWIWGWRVPPGAGRWLTFSFNFKSPYFTPVR